jgi:hypothetical protein
MLHVVSYERNVGERGVNDLAGAETQHGASMAIYSNPTDPDFGWRHGVFVCPAKGSADVCVQGGE